MADPGMFASRFISGTWRNRGWIRPPTRKKISKVVLDDLKWRQGVGAELHEFMHDESALVTWGRVVLRAPGVGGRRGRVLGHYRVRYSIVEIWQISKMTPCSCGDHLRVRLIGFESFAAWP